MVPCVPTPTPRAPLSEEAAIKSAMLLPCHPCFLFVIRNTHTHLPRAPSPRFPAFRDPVFFFNAFVKGCSVHESYQPVIARRREGEGGCRIGSGSVLSPTKKKRQIFARLENREAIDRGGGVTGWCLLFVHGAWVQKPPSHTNTLACTARLAAFIYTAGIPLLPPIGLPEKRRRTLLALACVLLTSHA